MRNHQWVVFESLGSDGIFPSARKRLGPEWQLPGRFRPRFLGLTTGNLGSVGRQDVVRAVKQYKA